jgi:TfoX/Sxy family transcriptional regulator of competence genes
MKWKKAPEELVRRFDEILPADPRVERRSMFGYPCAFSGGNMFIGLHQDNLVLRLPEAERTKFLALKGATIFKPMPGRAMREYVVVPKDLIGDTKALARWVMVALAYAAALPPKKAKKKRSSSAGR